MKIRIVTEYENIDADWLKWYFRHLTKNPALKQVVRDLKEIGLATLENSFESVVGKTTYEVIK